MGWVPPSIPPDRPGATKEERKRILGAYSKQLGDLSSKQLSMWSYVIRCFMVVVLLIVFSWFVSFIQAGESHFVTTPPFIVEAMLDSVNVSSEDIVIDLGCGDGRIPIIASIKYGVKSIGIENDPEIVVIAKRNVKRNNVSHLVSIRQDDVLKVQWEDSPIVVTLYLDSELLRKLKPVLERLSIGSRIVSHQHPIPGWLQGKEIELREHLLYRYRVVQKIRKQKICGPRGCTYLDIKYKVVVGY